MKQKLTLVLIALFTTMGAWATDVVISDRTNTVATGDVTTTNEHKYGTYSNAAGGTTFTTNATSGMAGVTVTADAAMIRAAYFSGANYLYVMGFNPSDANAHTITISAPDGYLVTGYSITAISTSSGRTFSVTPAGDTPKNVTAPGTTEINKTGLSSQTATITIQAANASTGNFLCFPLFTVTVLPQEIYNAKASITNGRLYRIFTKNNGTAEGDTKYYLTTSGTLTTETASAGEFVFNATASNGYVPAGYAWKISNGDYRFTNRPYQTPGQTHLNTTSGNNRDTYEAQVFYLNEGKYAVRSTNFNGSGSDYVQNSYWTVVADITGDGIPDATYDDTEGTKHYVWQLEEVVSVTFNLIYEGNTIASTGPLDNSSGTYNGTCSGTASLPTDTWSNPYCSYSYSPTTITSETPTVNITMTWEGPFTISSDYASATWSYLKLRGKYAKYDEDLTITSDVAYPLYASKDDVRYTDEGLWAFVGNPIQGVRVFNKAAGSDKCIQWTTQPKMDLTSYGNAVYWKIGKLDGYGFLLYYGGFYLHDLGGNTPGKLGIWNGGGASTDPGSAFVIEDLDWRDKAVFAVQDYAKAYTMNNYFGIDEVLYNSTITAIKDYPSFTEDMYNGTITSLNNGELLKYPTTGNYLIKNCYTSKYVVASDNLVSVNSSVDANAIVHLTDNGDGTYSFALQGKYVGEPTKNLSGTISLANDPVNFTWELADPGYVRFKKSDIYLWNAGSTMTGWVGGNQGSMWAIEDVSDLSISLNSDGAEPATYYATFCAPFSYTVSGAKAYTLERSDNVLTPTEVDGAVPAGTPVLLQGTSATATLTISGTDYAATPLTTTALTGTYLAKTINGGSDYVLGINGGVVGFYHWNSNNLGANRAYIVGGGGNVKGYVLNFDDEPDAIKTLSDSPLKGENIYNLAGQRISKMQKGINIVNGKKIMVK